METVGAPGEGQLREGGLKAVGQTGEGLEFAVLLAGLVVVDGRGLRGGSR